MASVSAVVVVADTAVATVTFVVVVVSRGMEFNLASSTASRVSKSVMRPMDRYIDEIVILAEMNNTGRNEGTDYRRFWRVCVRSCWKSC